MEKYRKLYIELTEKIEQLKIELEEEKEAILDQYYSAI